MPITHLVVLDVIISAILPRLFLWYLINAVEISRSLFKAFTNTIGNCPWNTAVFTHYSDKLQCSYVDADEVQMTANLVDRDIPGVGLCQLNVDSKEILIIFTQSYSCLIFGSNFRCSLVGIARGALFYGIEFHAQTMVTERSGEVVMQSQSHSSENEWCCLRRYMFGRPLDSRFGNVSVFASRRHRIDGAHIVMRSLHVPNRYATKSSSSNL